MSNILYSILLVIISLEDLIGAMFVIMKSEIPRLILTLRKRLGLSQEKLAAQLGVSFQTVNRWERGHSKPSQLALHAIKQKLIEMGEAGQDLLDNYFEEEPRQDMDDRKFQT